MKKTDSFADQYKHPKWQKRRLDILSSKDYECEFCGDKETELQVHHIEYKQGNKVWEYQDDNFLCLCRPCHKRLTEVLSDTRKKAGWEVYLYALESLNSAWKNNNRESLGIILHILDSKPIMIEPVKEMLMSLEKEVHHEAIHGH